MDSEKTIVYLDNDEARIFIELRRIAMKNGSVHLNYDKNGRMQSIDEIRHLELSTSLNNNKIDF